VKELEKVSFMIQKFDEQCLFLIFKREVELAVPLEEFYRNVHILSFGLKKSNLPP